MSLAEWIDDEPEEDQATAEESLDLGAPGSVRCRSSLYWLDDDEPFTGPEQLSPSQPLSIQLEEFERFWKGSTASLQAALARARTVLLHISAHPLRDVDSMFTHVESLQESVQQLRIALANLAESEADDDDSPHPLIDWRAVNREQREGWSGSLLGDDGSVLEPSQIALLHVSIEEDPDEDPLD